MRFIYDGEVQQATLFEWLDRWEANPEQREAMDEWAREATILNDEGEPLAGRALQRFRDRLLQTYDDMPRLGVRRRTLGPRRFLIPGLWPWGTIPALGGNYKAGKSTVVTDLARALVVSGYRFLDYFEPVEAGEVQQFGVVVINAETPAEDFETALSIGMTTGDPGRAQGWDLLTVEHLEDLGGAQIMDLTNPAIYDLWADRLADCNDCDGTDDWTPSVVIVDGVTAIGLAIGKEPEDYFGKWYAAFRRLLRECDVPNGLATGHSTMSGGHLMGGTGASAGPDGLWTFSADQIDKPKSARRFSVQPRMGGVPICPTRVVLNEDGRPVVPPKQSEPDPELYDQEPDLVTAIAHRTAEYVREHPGAHGEELSQNVEDGGWKDNNLKGRGKALDLGLIRKEPCRPGCQHCKKSHHKRSHYYPV